MEVKIKKILSVLFLCCVILPIVSCKNENYTTEQEKMEITFSFWEPGVYRELETALEDVAEEYEKEHPDINIKFITKPVDDYGKWIKMRIAADNMPDIESNHQNELLKQYEAGLIADISEVLQKESNYQKGEMWKDTFLSEEFELANPDVEFNIPLFKVELAMFYNKTLYDELGLKVPKTWREFINNCEVIEKAGKTPIVMMGQKKAAESWLQWEIGISLYIKKYLADKSININGDSVISEYEKARAIVLGLWDVSKDVEIQNEYKNYLSHLSEYLNYCKDSSDNEESVAKMIFLSGDVGHINTGSWDLGSFMNRQDSTFEVGTFKFPEFTEEDTEYPGGRVLANGVQSIAVTTSVYKQEGKFEAAVDFLQYLTSKDVYQKFIDQTSEIPTIEGIVPDEKLSDFVVDGFPNASNMFSGTETWVSDILSGDIPVLDQEYFDEFNKKRIESSKRLLDALNLSPDNGYYYSEKISGGLYNDVRQEEEK